MLNSRIAAIKYGKETNKLKATIKNRIEKLGNADNTKEIENIRKLITGGGLGNNESRTTYFNNLNAKISSLRPVTTSAPEPVTATAPEPVTAQPNANRLQGILKKLQDAPSGSNNNIENKLTVLNENNRNFLRNVNDTKLNNKLLKNAKLAIAQQATTAVTEAEQ